MKFSICIPNYNYERFLARTIQSVLAQSYQDLEIIVSDNCSTDKSVEVVKSFADPRIVLTVNACNVGFAGNLDRAARPASGERVIMLSSDDLIRPEGLATYRKFCDALGPAAEEAVFTSSWDIIDPQDRVTGRSGPIPGVWSEADRVPSLDAVAGGPVYGVDAAELLKRCLLTMKNPFNFAATCYPRSLYDAVEGYGGGRMINPDKCFHWKLLSRAKRAYFIDREWFAYRVHDNNQTAQQAAAGALKYLVDEYASTLEPDAALLERIGISREQFCGAFVEYDIARHGLATLGRGQRGRAKRIYWFGRAAYPQLVNRNRKAWILRALLTAGPLGVWLARASYRRYSAGSAEFG